MDFNKVIKIIKPSSKSEIKQYYQIRFEELRKPWDQLPGSEKDSIEDNCVHRMIKLDGDYAGVARLEYNTNLQAQIRYMAIKQKHQMNGLGKILVMDLENIAKKNGMNEMILQSRELAVPFYLSLELFMVVTSTFSYF